MNDTAAVKQARWYAEAAINESAGMARARYITATVGQEATYLMKLSQAQQYLAAVATNANATVPAYVAAEAAATNTSASNAANLIVATAAQWNDALGPAIEQARRAGNIAVAAAQTVDDVIAARSTAINTLDAL